MKNMAENEINENSDFETILQLIQDGEFTKKYSSYIIKKYEKGYFIKEKEKEKDIKKDKENEFFIFKRKIKVKFQGNHFSKEIDVFSSLEIEDFAKKNLMKVTELFIKKKYNEYIQFNEILKSIGSFIKNDILEIFLKKSNILPKIILKEPLDENKDYKPGEYSDYFYDYFKYENQQDKDKEFQYVKNEMREIIYTNLISLRDERNLKTYKFTGPASIGKSFTLFYCSHISFNMIYINLKTIENNINDLYKCYRIIISELERLDIENNLDELNEVIQECLDKLYSPLKLIIYIMNFLFNKYNNDSNFVFILDQYKKKYIPDGFEVNIDKCKNIKFVFCCSINDKTMRDQCIITWRNNVKNITDFNEDTQQYFFYYSNIYTDERKDDDNSILKKFNYIPKYVSLYEKNKKNDELLIKEAKKIILDKIKEFCNNKEDEFYDLLIHLRYIIGKDYPFKELETVMTYCLLKFFRITFKDDENSFKITPIFPFMNNIIRIQVTENICYDYFKNHSYRKNTIENEAVKGCYFEASVKFGLENIKLPFENNELIKTITLNEISTMDKIIDSDSYYNEDENDLNNDNNINMNNNNLLKGNNDNNSKNKDLFDKFLKTFKLDYNEIEKNKENKYKDLVSNSTLVLSRDIEYFRANELINLKNKNEELYLNKNFSGNESLKLDQIKKQGRVFDYGLLYGNQYEKIFIGFQMKCYFKSSYLSDSVIDKYEVKEKSQKILVNSMKLFNCKITKWHYILIFYINKENEKENINERNLFDCNRNSIHYIFYSPENNQFYDQKKNKINKLELLDISNLDICKVNMKKYFEFLEKMFFKRERIIVSGNLEKMIESFIEDLSWLVTSNDNNEEIIEENNEVNSEENSEENNEENSEDNSKDSNEDNSEDNNEDNNKNKMLKNILSKIKSIIKIKVKFDVQINLEDPFYLFPPIDNNILIYKMNDNFILIKWNKKFTKLDILNLKTKKKISNVYDFYKMAEGYCGYYYRLERQDLIKEIYKEAKIK